MAGVMALWVEDVDGDDVLMSRRGETLGCFATTLEEEPGPVLLAPEGIPANVYRLIDRCANEPVPGYPLELRFDAVDGVLTWDPEQEHPRIEVVTDSEGIAVFAVRGGGCAETGLVSLRCLIQPLWGWTGAKSPDVDGNCIVTDSDLTYVQSMLGTDDFCADLDGSGVVDECDVAIVLSTLGDHCSDVTAAPGMPEEGTGGPWLQLSPNPCRGVSRIRLSVPRPGAAHVRILDAAGRLVRDLGRKKHPAGVTDIMWDTRDGHGHPVASGIYFASASIEQRMLRRSVLVLR
jgi:hypothetical protein